MHTPPMIPRLLCILGLSLATLTAADPAPEDLLRQGLFEEEANRDLDKAADAYRAVIAVHDRQRALAATATFRLGEIARKKNDSEAAAAAFRTVVERFPEQTEIARLSRENLAALGMAAPTPESDPFAEVAPPDPEDLEIERLKGVAKNSPDMLDGATDTGWRPLHLAAANGQMKVMAYLLENHADPNSRTINEQLTPLQLAAVYGRLAAVSMLITATADVNATVGMSPEFGKELPPTDPRANKASGKWTALDLAILYDRQEVARTLIEAGADLKQIGPVVRYYSDELTPLALAIYLKRNDLAQALIDAGSPLGPMDNNNPGTPLGVAVRDNQEMVVPLLKAGADPKLPYSKNGVTPLQSAAGSIEIAKLLIDAGADVNSKDTEGNTPLHWSFSPEAIDFLVSKGADINAKNSAGLTPLENFTANIGGSNKEMVEAFLKHGATVEDPIGLLRRSSKDNVSPVRELIVYPREKRADAILLSVSGPHSFNHDPPNEPRPGVVPAGGSSSQSRPDLITLEVRPTADTPPPSLAEALCEAYDSYRSSYPQSIRILRPTTNDGFAPVLEWKQTDGAAIPKDWPALQWGDIVEVSVTSGYSGNQEPPSIRDLSATIPARSVTFRLGGLTIPQTIPGGNSFWLSEQTLRALIPNTEYLADLTRFIVHRKGAAAPISVDFTKPTETRFRLIDGDLVELSLNLPHLYRQFGNGDGVSFISLGGDNGRGGFGEMNLIKLFADFLTNSPIDFQNILILRRAEDWKPEIIDVKAWLDTLPPSEKWERDSILASTPKLNEGDIIVLSPDPGPSAEKTTREVRSKLQQIKLMSSQPPLPMPAAKKVQQPPRPQVVPPPSQPH